MKRIGSDKTEYERHIWFRKNHVYSREYLQGLELPELIEVAKKVMGYEKNREF